jgi:hypothetical protein
VTSPSRRAGRPRKGTLRRLRASFTLDPDRFAWLQALAESRGSSVSDTLDELLREAQAKPGRKASRARIPVAPGRIAAFCRANGIQWLALFGSVLTERFGPQSDVDLLVEFEPGASVSLFRMSELEAELSRILGGRKVDLRTPGDLSRYFKNEVLSEAETLYAA